MDVVQLEEIKSFLHTHGVTTAEPSVSDVDGPWVGVREPGGFSGGYLIVSDPRGGFTVVVNDWRSKGSKPKLRVGGEPLTAADRKEQRRILKERAKETATTHGLVMSAVSKFIQMHERHGLKSCPYLNDKGLGDCDEMAFVRPGLDNNVSVLCVPMQDETGVIWNIQQIWPKSSRAADRTKRFWDKGRVAGLYHVLRGANGPSKVLLGEGYATCLAALKASGLTTYCAFSAENLEAVLRVMLKRYQASQIVLLVDWDVPLQTGLRECIRLVEKYRVELVLPYPPDTILPGASVDCADTFKDNPEYLKAAVEVPFGLKGIEALKEFLRESETEDNLSTPQTPDRPPGAEVGQVCEAKAQGDLGPDGSDSVEEESFFEAAELPDGDLGTGDRPEPLKVDYSFIVKAPDRELVNLNGLNAGLLPDRKGENGTGGIKATLQNFRVLMHHLGATLRYNVITKREEWIIPGVKASPDNYERVVYAHVEDACGRVGFPLERISSFATTLCDENQFNPVAAWVTSRAWDKKSRLHELFDTIETAPDVEELKKTFVRKWMIMAIAAAFEPDGIEAAGMLVFQGPQYIGKTRWLMSLVPRELKLAAQGVILDVGNADSVRAAIGYWLVELGELDGTMKRSEQNSLKAFITKGADTLRAPYARASNTYCRRTVFFGSVNEQAFLTDRTGNRRYWVIAVEKLEHDHNIDIQQLWAEVYELWRRGESWRPTDAEMARMNESNESFDELDPLMDLLLKHFDWAQQGPDMIASKLGESVGLMAPLPKWQLNQLAGSARKLAAGRQPKCKRSKFGPHLFVGMPRKLRS